MEAEDKSNRKINILPMIVGCVVVFCTMLLLIRLLFPSYYLDLWFYFSYMTVACTFIPLQTPQVAMVYGAKYWVIYGWYGLILIAILGGIGSCISGLVDYTLVTALSQSKKIAKLKNTQTYNKYFEPLYNYVQRLYGKAPFLILVIAAFTPIPFEPVKLLACIKRYNRIKFVSAIFSGRTPRYFILGLLAIGIQIPPIYLYGSIVVIMIIGVVRDRLKKLMYKNKKTVNLNNKEDFMKALSMSQSILIPSRVLMGCLRKRPWILSFEVTLSCVANCKHCDTGGFRENEQRMSPPEYRKYISTLKPAVVQLSGGEPLLRDDLAEIIRQIKNGSSMPYIIVVTNGHLFNEDRYNELKEAGADRFSLSLDFPNEKHDEFRGIPGLYKHLDELIPKLASYGNDDIAMNCCITLPNVSYMEASAEKCHEWGVAISYSAYSKKRMGDPQFFISEKSDLETLKKGIDNLIKMKRQGIKILNPDSSLLNFYKFFKEDGFPNCGAGRTFLVVRPEGTMNPCSMFREKRYTDQREMLKDFSEHNDCKDCYVAIRAYSDKSIWLLVKDAIEINRR